MPPPFRKKWTPDDPPLSPRPELKPPTHATCIGSARKTVSRNGSLNHCTLTRDSSKYGVGKGIHNFLMLINIKKNY